MDFFEEVPDIGIGEKEFCCRERVGGVLEEGEGFIFGGWGVIRDGRSELEAEHHGFTDSTGGDGEFAVGRDDWVEDDVGAIRDEGVSAVGNLRVCAGRAG